MKLVFKRRFGLGYVERDTPITLNLGTLEAVCKSFNIEFWQMAETFKKNDFDFIVEILYQGYISACKDRYKRPKYKLSDAATWKEYMSQSAQKEFADLMTDLFGNLTKAAPDKKKEGNESG
jgi:hypothetical protein